MRSLWLTTVATIIAGCTVALVHAQPAPEDALDGLDPVLLVQSKEVAGKPDLTVVRGRFAYSFSSAETRAAFERTPEQFEIQLNGVCARMGPMAGGNPLDYVVHDGRIYIFGSDECHKRFVASPTRFLPPVPAAMPAGAKASAEGRALVDRAASAIGGAARLDALTLYVESWTYVQTAAQGEVPVAARLLWRFPSGVRLERTITRADRRVSTATVLTSDRAWFDGGPGRIFPMLPDAVPELERTYGRHLVPLLRSRTAPTFEAAALGPATLAGLAVERVRLRNGPVDVTLGIDRLSGEIRAMSFVGRNGEGEFGEYEVAVSDYRAVAGLRLPFSERALFNGTPDTSVTRTLEAIALDVALDDALFTTAAGPGQ